MPADDVREQLLRIADYESGLKRNPLTTFLVTFARTRVFAWLYPKVGPRVDPVVYRRTSGSAAARIYGLPALLLTTTGARSGQPRTATLIYVRDGDDFAVVGTNFGKRHHPAWTENLLAHPDATVEVGPVRITIRAALADESAWDRLWQKFLAVYPGYDSYLARSGRRPRIFLLAPVAGSPGEQPGDAPRQTTESNSAAQARPA